MSGLIESASAILRASEKRVELFAHNVANISTPGFKRQLGFLKTVDAKIAMRTTSSDLSVSRVFTQGKIGETGNPLDFAIAGQGFFQLRSADQIIYSRQGQFRLGDDGTLISPQGYVLQQQGGGDLVVGGNSVVVAQDGTVMEDGRAIARIDLVVPTDTSALEAIGESHFSVSPEEMEPVQNPSIRQGSIEHSNVELGDEMVALMAATRQSETGARLVQVYDDLIGRAISTLGQGR